MTEKETETRIKFKGLKMILMQILLIPYSLFLGYYLFNLASQIDNKPLYVFGFIIDIIFLFIIIVVFKKTINIVNFVTINKLGIKIRRPFKFKNLNFDWSKIKGYSKTNYEYIGGRFPKSCKSIIIYTKSNLTFEIVEIYNSNFQEFQNNMNNFNVICFGTEKYERGRFGKRKKYKFIDLYNN